MPPAPPGWISANGLSKAGVLQGRLAINIKLSTFRNSLIEDLNAAGIAHHDALQMIDDNLIGVKQPSLGRPCLHVSPDAVAILERDGWLQRSANAPSAVPDGWTSGSRLSRSGYRGNQSSLDATLRTLRIKLIQHIRDQLRIPEHEAEQIVEHNLIGRRKPTRGPIGLYASPETVAMLEDDHLLAKRSDSRRDWRTRVANPTFTDIPDKNSDLSK